MKSTIKMCIALLMTMSIMVSAPSSAQVQLQGPTKTADAYSGVVYGPIDQNDTLWRIASRYKQGSEFSVYQTMLAIYELNPQAFENQNFNTMVNGATLQLPSDRFIARMDVRRARAKAEADDRAFGRPNSVQPESVINEVANAKPEPEVPLVNQEDLSATKQELQRQLNNINRQQNRQFNELKEQFGASIANVQTLLEENRRLYERLDQVNQDIADLREKVEGEVQAQIDQQLALQQEVIDLVKQSEQRQLEREANSIWSALASPLVIGIVSTVLSIGVLVILAIWLLRKPKEAAKPQKPAIEEDIVDDELVIGEMEEDDAEDLMAALDQDLGDDDILSADLEDGLDELGIDENGFEDADELLVPDVDDFENDQTALADALEDEVNFDTDAINLDDDDFENQEIDLTPPVSEDDDSEQDLVDAQDESENTEKQSEGPEPAASDNLSEEEAIDPDDLLASVQAESEQDVRPSAPSNKLASNESDADIELPSEGITEESLVEIENSINSTTDEFDALSEEILNDLEGASAEEQSDQASSAADINTEEPPIPENAAEAEPEPKQEPEPKPKPKPEPEPDTQSEAAISTETESKAESNEQEGPKADIESDLAAETEALADDVESSDTTETQDAASTNKASKDLDEDSDSVASDELDDLLEQFAKEPDVGTELVDELDDALVNDVPDDPANELADELLAELEEEDSVSDEDLDALLDEYTANPDADIDDIASDSLPNQDDSSAFLDDIPSLASMTQDTVSEAEEELEDNTEELDVKIESKDSEGFAPLESDKSPDELPPQDSKSQDTDDISSVSEGSNLEEDVLADLPGLDDWLSDDEIPQDLKNIDNNNDNGDELNVLADIEGSDFEELLSEIDADSLDISEDLKALENLPDEDIDDELLNRAGLDLDTLMQEDQSKDESVEDFVNVDDLLSESESLTPLEDDEIELNLEKSMGRMPRQEGVEDGISMSDDDIISEQASNLDLAQVYMDMDDLEAATEALEEVVKKGSEEQIAEATELLKQIKKGS